MIRESNDFDWVKRHMESIPDKPEAEALIKHLGSQNVLGDGFDPEESDWYGNIDVIKTSNGEEWVVGTETSMGNAIHEYLDDYIDGEGYEHFNIDLDDYIDVDYYWLSTFCDSEADNQFYDMSNEDYLKDYGDYDILAEIEELNEEYEELEKEYEEVEEIINQYREALETMEIQNQDYIQYGYLEQPHTEEEFEVFQNKVDKLTNVLITIEKKLEDIPETKEEYIEKLKEYVRQDYIDECERCMETPIHCLVDVKGFYSDGTEALEYLGLFVDRDSIIRYISDDYTDYHQLPSYDGNYYTEEVNGVEYILIRIN
jgi:archaellum component FlaC